MKLDLESEARMMLRMKAICDHINDKKEIIKNQITQRDVLNVFESCGSVLSRPVLNFCWEIRLLKENFNNRDNRMVVCG